MGPGESASDRSRRELRRHDDQLRRLKRGQDDTARALRRREDADRALARRMDEEKRRESQGGRDQRQQNVDDQISTWAVPVAIAASIPLAVGHLSAMLVHGSWPRYPLREVPGILRRLVARPGDPGSAWEPVNTGAEVPGPVGWWGTFVLVLVVVGLVVVLAWAWSGTGPAVRRDRSGWASARDLRPLWLTRRNERHRLVLGTSDGHSLGLAERHSLLVLGAAHTGKTSGLTIPAVLEWPGPVVVATSKGHLIDQTIGWRSRLGEVHVFDPAAVTRYHRSGWSLLAGCGTWQGAIRSAADLAWASRAAAGVGRSTVAGVDGGAGAGQAGHTDLWRSSMAMALAPYLFAAVSSGRSIRTAVEWIGREERDEVLEILDGVDRTAARTYRTTFDGPDPDRAAFMRAMHQILSVYHDPVVAPSMDRHEIVPGELLDGGSHTLYLTAPEHSQARFRPLCAAVMRQVLAAAFELSASQGGPLDEQLLVVFDDAVGVAPVDDLASLASTAGARGVQVVSVFQDLGQIAGHYGDDADRVVRNHTAKLVLPGRSPEPSWGGMDELLSAEQARQLGPFEAALLYDTAAPARVRLRPWFHDKELERRVATPQDAVQPAEDHELPDRFDPAEQTSMWLRRQREARGRRDDDATIPFDVDDPDYVAVFGRVEEAQVPHNVAPLDDRRFRS